MKNGRVIHYNFLTYAHPASQALLVETLTVVDSISSLLTPSYRASLALNIIRPSQG